MTDGEEKEGEEVVVGEARQEWTERRAGAVASSSSFPACSSSSSPPEDCYIQALPAPLLLQVFSSLRAKDMAAVAEVGKLWRQLASDDILWEALCSADWLARSLPSSPDGDPLPSYKEMYLSFHSEFSGYGSLFGRARECWASLRSWLNANMPEVEASLAPGVSESDLDAAEAQLGVKLPPAMRILYRLCDGQVLKYDCQLDTTGQAESDPSAFHGLLGGYSFYDHNVNVRLLPLQRILFWTGRIAPYCHLPPGSQKIVIATSFNLLKLVFLDCADGMVYVGTRTMMSSGDMVPCVPVSEDHADSAVAKDGLLRWMEEYSRRLQSGMYIVRNLNDWKHSRGISLYPELQPQCTLATTQRVQVRCSTIFVPEKCTLTYGDDDKHFFTYSVRMRLLPLTPETDDGQHTSCQLRSRHWMIKDADRLASDVRGDAVIGKYPLLQEGQEEEFVYQSCVGLRSATGSIEGEFRFVPGSLARPTGDEFDAQVARFPMEVPSYIF